MNKHFLLFLLFIIVISCAQAQLTISPELKTALQDKKGFTEIMQTVDDYYIRKGYTNDPKLYSQYKKWCRWGWYMGSHLDSTGRVANVSDKTWVASRESGVERFPSNDGPGNSPNSNTGFWGPIGPYTIANGVGRVDRLAFHPSNGNILYAGTPAGGLWRTLDGGANWHALNGYLPNIGVSGIVIDRDNANILYILTGDGDSNISGGFVLGFDYIRPSIGILKSTDGGGTWTRISEIVTPGTKFYGYKLVQSEDFHNRFFACTSDGLYMSNDYGVTWTRNANIGVDVVYDLELGPANTGFVYACTNRRVYVSTNWGNPFTVVPLASFSTQPSANDRSSLAVTPNAPNDLFVSFGASRLLYRSTDNGTTYTLVNNNSPVTQQYMAAFAVSPTNANTLVVGEVALQRSTNGGSGFSATGAGTVHADVHELAFNPVNNFLYAACDGGVYRSTDLGATWASLFNGMQITQFYHFAGVTGSGTYILGGAQDNGNIQSSSSGGLYNLEFGGDGFESAYLNGNNNLYYYTTNTLVGKGTRSPAGRVEKSPAGASGFYPSVAIHPTNDQIIYAGYSNGVYRSDNDGVNWTNKGQAGSAGGNPAGGLAVSAATPDRIYAAGNTTLARSDNKGDTWTTLSGNPGWPAVSSLVPITDITTRSNNADEIWVTLGGYAAGAKVYYSSNAGATWVNLSGTLPNMPVYCIKYTSEGDAYIGTDFGVYFMDFTMNDWVAFSNGLPWVPVSDLVINENDGIIRAATFGRGIWQGDLYSNCSPLLLLGGIIQGNIFYQSSGIIESTQQVPGSSGNSLKLRAPTKITFKPGFSIRANAKLHAVIGNCGQGVVNGAVPTEAALSKQAYLQTLSDPKK